jgi:hypothetical protein
MLRRWVRLFVAVATALAAWVVATPAHAAAPLCDQRGATMFAPAPQLQPIETSIDVGPAPEDSCLADLAQASADDGRAPQAPDARVSADPAVPNLSHGVIDPPWVPTRTARDVTVAERDGVRSSIERPPRG